MVHCSCAAHTQRHTGNRHIHNVADITDRTEAGIFFIFAHFHESENTLKRIHCTLWIHTEQYGSTKPFDRMFSRNAFLHPSICCSFFPLNKLQTQAFAIFEL
ncbi:hypothetical protein D3C74_465640 [compost metagenome]